MDDELEHSPRSWMDNFTQWFSWCRPSARASPFLKNYFLPGVICWYPPRQIQFIFPKQRLPFMTSVYCKQCAAVMHLGLDSSGANTMFGIGFVETLIT